MVASDGVMRANITTDVGYFITDALEFIEDEAANNTIHVMGEDAASGDEEESKVIDTSRDRAASANFVENYETPKMGVWDVEKIPDWSRRTAAYNRE